MQKRTSQKSLASIPVVFDRENDGRWIAEIPKLPGVMAYGATKLQAKQRASAIALRTLVAVAYS